MNIHLIVVKAFDGLARGDIVTDPVRVAQILSSESAHSVVRVLTARVKEG
jgi:hypothetical protein